MRVAKGVRIDASAAEGVGGCGVKRYSQNLVKVNRKFIYSENWAILAILMQNKTRIHARLYENAVKSQ